MSSASFFAAGCLVAAVLHGLAAGTLHALSQRVRRGRFVLALLGELELVFVLWALVMIGGQAFLEGIAPALQYLSGQRFTEPLFVFAVMLVAGTRPVRDVAGRFTTALGRRLPGRGVVGAYFAALGVLPLLGSLITEVAAMTVAALVLRDQVFAATRSTRLLYGTLGVLFVNVSIGGVLTDFAAPPVLMVAHRWGWHSGDLFALFGLRAVLAVLGNALIATWLFRRELSGIEVQSVPEAALRVPGRIVLAQLLFLAAVVVTGHEPLQFLGVLAAFLVFTRCSRRHQDALPWRNAVLVAAFLAGLVVLGGAQRPWLQPLLAGFDARGVFYAAAGLTAVTDNAALTYLGSLVEGLSHDFKVSLLAGAVAGGGLTIIANAPNPAGAAILRDRFPGGALSSLGLLLAALAPTAVAVLAFRLG